MQTNWKLQGRANKRFLTKIERWSKDEEKRIRDWEIEGKHIRVWIVWTREENVLYPNSGRPTTHQNEEGAPSRGGRCLIESKMHASSKNVFLGTYSKQRKKYSKGLKRWNRKGE